MRSILDSCTCGGKLIPKTHTVGGTPMHLRIAGPGGRGQGGSTVIHHLECDTCGLMYGAKLAGQTLASLRDVAKKAELPAIPKPKHCLCCTSTEIKTESPEQDRFSRPDRFFVGEGFKHTDKPPTFIYCGACNSVLGTLANDKTP